jgi:UDP-N-acetylmuramoylalanine--D-glutamate ligase
VLGLGLTGLSLARISRATARVRVADTRAHRRTPARSRARFPACARDRPVSRRDVRGADLIAISPAWRRTSRDRAPSRDGAELVGDVELFARALPREQKVLAITGTNGKTTVTALTGARPRAAGCRRSSRATSATPVLDVLERTRCGEPWPDVFVLELSSYQLETTSSLKPVAAAVLNVSANHHRPLRGHRDYAAAKARIFAQAACRSSTATIRSCG